MTKVFTLTDNCTGSMSRNNRLGINVKFAPTREVRARCSDSSCELKREITVYSWHIFHLI